MTALTRRGFLALTSALAASLGLPKDMLGRALAAPAAPADFPSTLGQTILQKTTAQNRNYRVLTTGPGEPYVTRLDLVTGPPSEARVAARRSLAYLGHTSDIHIIDAQSPVRLEPISEFSTTLMPGNFRPQETMSVYVQAQMMQALSNAAFSPVTGAPMLAVLNTGDNADQLSHLELRWDIDVFDGVTVDPNSGKSGVYEGVQVWPEAAYAYHPDDPASDPFGQYGFPQIPDLMNIVMSQEVTSPGSPAPWYTVYGNHDTLYNGTFGIDESLRNLATGNKKPYSFEGLTIDYFRGMTSDSSPMTRAFNNLRQQFGTMNGFNRVTADTRRYLLVAQDFMAEHLNSPAVPGPVGHGFTQANVDNKITYWTADVGPALRLFGLDTCNQVVGADGAVPESQFNWLQEQLQKALTEQKLAIVLSHHNSLTLENSAVNVFAPGDRLVHAEEFIEMLLAYPNMVAWFNGHTHINTVQAHPRTTGGSGGGFWEITTASCIDYPQQNQVVELVDNRDGTMSIFATTLDHDSPAVWTEGDFSQQGVASLSRQLAANDWVANPLMRRGSPLDRNVELVLPAPFDLSAITDTALETALATRQAEILARKGGTQ